MKVSELGEFGLIDVLASLVEAGRRNDESWNNLLIGVGDDAAAWRCQSGTQLGTIDALVEGTHFRLGMLSWEELGWKSLAINVSDIAAMGGSPRYALVSLALPEDTEVDDVVSFYHGMLALAATCGVAVAGGNLSRAPAVIINVAVLGEDGPSGRLLTRSGARGGDMIAVTGHLGGAAAGLSLLTEGRHLDIRTVDLLRQAFVRPVPRVKEGLILAENGVRAAIDLSDGLVSDLSHICRASSLGAHIDLDRLPLAAGLSESFADRALEWGLSGGEDYELLFTAPGRVVQSVRAELDCAVTVVGQMVADPTGTVRVLNADGSEFRLPRGGWDHFARPPAGLGQGKA
jgi:thiamine-monophosphate kinase